MSKRVTVLYKCDAVGVSPGNTPTSLFRANLLENLKSLDSLMLKLMIELLHMLQYMVNLIKPNSGKYQMPGEIDYKGGYEK